MRVSEIQILDFIECLPLLQKLTSILLTPPLLWDAYPSVLYLQLGVLQSQPELTTELILTARCHEHEDVNRSGATAQT